TDDPKGYFMELKPDNNFKAYAGCNNMAGHYEYRGERIHFMRIVGTMKACPNPTAEEEIKAVLETVDNFTRNGKTLIFKRGETITAKFEVGK
ncbi:MAG: META domain-containing protein, partial [Flavobacterium sp.]